MTYEEMEKNYKLTKFHKCYLLGFVYNKNVYAYATPEISWKHRVSSGGRGLQLRFEPAKKDKFEMVWNGAVKLMDYETFKSLTDHKNDGHAFEQIICDLYDQDGRPNSIPYWEAGDVVINGVPCQIKWESGSVAEQSIKKAMEVLGL